MIFFYYVGLDPCEESWKEEILHLILKDPAVTERHHVNFARMVKQHFPYLTTTAMTTYIRNLPFKDDPEERSFRQMIQNRLDERIRTNESKYKSIKREISIVSPTTSL